MSFIFGLVILSPGIIALSLLLMFFGFILITYKNKLAGLFGWIFYVIILYLFYFLNLVETTLLLVVLIFLIFYVFEGNEIINPLIKELYYRLRYLFSYISYIIRKLL
ncbi:MAG: hypothetical protein QXL76_00525 [Candidatus Rehaiarchaeum fermentans]|nr:hypothetical protein [Candidatus Rehaiarchaeum fermentans]